MSNGLKSYAKGIFNLAFPNLCEACQIELVGNEHLICVSCWHNMPKTNFHLQVGNHFEQKLIGRLRINRAASYYYFNQDSRVQEILHALKYQHKEEVGIELGRRYAHDLIACDWIKSIDLIVPIPLSKQKMKKRGFNQSEFFGRGLSEELNIPMDTESVVRIKNTQTQTTMNSSERIDNMKDAFEIKYPDRLMNKHILLIDDVVTTGATLESCALEIQQIQGIQFSLLTIAYAII